MINGQIRQGDVLLVRIAALPAGAVLKHEPKQGPAVLAEGEVTGHMHTVAGARLFTAEGEGVTYMTVEELTEVRHQEHEAKPVEPGVYEVRRQREWTDADEPRQVAD